MKNQLAQVHINELSSRDKTISLLIIGGLFFVIGLLSWVNAILIPYFKIACELTSFQSYLVAFAFYIAYFIMSVPASFVLKKFGFKRGMMFGFWAMSIGAFIFVPAALTRTYGLFLTGLFTIGIGLSILQTGTNPYVTILGAKEKAAQRLSMMGIFNKGAGILAPLLFAAVILRPTDTALFGQLASMTDIERGAALDELVRRVVTPYTIIGSLLFIFGILLYLSPLPEINSEHESPELAAANSGKTSIFQFPHLILGAFAIFVHTGTQIISIDTVISYANSMGVNLLEAKVFPSYTLFCTICGYLLGIALIPRLISQVNALRFCTILGLVLTFSIIFVHGTITFLGHTTDISIWFVVLLGLANSLVWAGIWPLALSELGRYTKLGASILIMGLCGNAIMPLFYGLFADEYSLRLAYWVLCPCYLYLVFYAFTGHKIRRWGF